MFSTASKHIFLSVAGALRMVLYANLTPANISSTNANTYPTSSTRTTATAATATAMISATNRI